MGGGDARTLRVFVLFSTERMFPKFYCEHFSVHDKEIMIHPVFMCSVKSSHNWYFAAVRSFLSMMPVTETRLDPQVLHMLVVYNADQNQCLNYYPEMRKIKRLF